MNAKLRLFEEPLDDFNETWRHGALLGGMASPTGYFELARAFRLCADTIVDQNGERFEAYEVVYPLLFLYRHALELYLKAILGPQGRHPLGVLMRRLEQRVQ